MAMGTERSKALHNFTMPGGVRWGNQRFLRCMKVNSAGQFSQPSRFADGSSDHHHRHPIQQRRATRERDKDSPLDFRHESPKVGPTPSHARRRFSDAAADDGDDGIAATREKVMLDLQTAADRMKVAIFKDGLEEGGVSAPPPASDAEAESYSRWNLRTRRASRRTAASGFVSGKHGGSPGAAAASGNDVDGGKSLKADAARPNSGSSQMRTATAAIATRASQKSPMHRYDGNGTPPPAAAANGKKRLREKLSVPLSRKDIEEDFYAMVGHRPPRRPKKRARTVQKQLDTLFPGLWLTEVTPDMYKVIETSP